MTFLPKLPAEWEDTRTTMHRYAQAVGVVPRVHAPPHPQWWHVSLKVRPTGLTTDPMPLPDGGSFHLRMDPRDHAVHLETSHGDARVFPMTEGRSGTRFGEGLLEAVAGLGLEGEYERDRFESDDPGTYDPAAAETFWAALVNVAAVFEEHNAAIEGDHGPVQLWPHGFDLATEWFGDGEESWTHGDQSGTSPWQINLGFYPGGDAYFYSNPWPFHGDEVTGHDLPHGARWVTDEFEGSKLPYADLAGDPDARDKLGEYAMAVWEAASPTLTKD
ncbi:MAG: DUF5996 family protein [Acidimicrobiia bacterium]|nr:DUF5996 family protein [Acidimicrobiia bacterium]